MHDHPLPPSRWIVGGALGPAVFISAWATLGARTDGYSAVGDTISELAGLGAPTRVWMTSALMAFAGCMFAYARAVRDVLGSGVARAATVNGVASLAVAATPLGSALGGVPHALAAGTAYASLAAMPALSVRPAMRAGHRRLSVIGPAVAVAIVASLMAAAFARTDVGWWQRVGLTIGDCWLITSVATLRPRHDRSVTSRLDDDPTPTLQFGGQRGRGQPPDRPLRRGQPLDR